MSKVKDTLYDFFVKRNGRVWYEYERFVRENIEEHRSHHLKHIKVLLKLNWFYRVKKGNTPYLYWDTPLGVKSDNKPEKQLVKLISISEYEEKKRQTAYAYAVALKDYDVVSFDIFDTLILRNINLPEHLFMILEDIFGVYDFRRLRVQAEKDVRERNLLKNGNRECTIREIYEQIYWLTGMDIDYGVSNEFKVELDLCVRNEYIYQVFRIMKGMGKKIYATSNMYFPKEMMTKILEKCGYTGFEDILVSCDYSCSKTSGALFEFLKYKEKNRKIVHVGDNKITDINGANKAGIDSKFYQACRERGEEYRARGFSSLIGSAYYACVNNTIHNGASILEKDQPMWEFGFKYAGMAAIGYANWIHSKSKGKDVVLFLSRDGAILKEVYDLMFNDIKSQYLLWSRIAAIRNVRFGETREQILERIFSENEDKGIIIEHLLSMLGWSELNRDMAASGIITSVPLCTENAMIVKRYLVENWNAVEKISQKIEENTINYLKGITGDSKKISIVDIGWTGKNALILKKILVKMGCQDKDVSIFLLGSVNKMQNPAKIYKNQLNCYMFSFNKNREIHDVFCKLSTYAIDVLEKIFSHPSCSFVGVSENEEFLFAYPEIENFDAYRAIEKGCIDFCKLYIQNYKNYNYMYNISGYDAWIPIRKALSNRQYINRLFSKLIYVQGIDNSENTHVSFKRLTK